MVAEGGGRGGAGVHRRRMRPTRLTANQIAGADTWQPIIGGSPHACRGSWGGVPDLRKSHPLWLASSDLILELPRAGERQTVLSPLPTGTGKDWSMVQPKRCLTAKGRVSRVPTRMRHCSAGRPVRARGPSGGSMRQDPQASGSFRPLPSLVWAGSALQQLSCPRGWDKAARGKGLLGPWPRAPPPALLWNLMYLNTHTHANLHGPTRFCTQLKKKKNRSSGLFTALVLWSFSCFFFLSSDSRAAPSLGALRFRPLVLEVGR